MTKKNVKPASSFPVLGLHGKSWFVGLFFLLQNPGITGFAVKKTK